MDMLAIKKSYSTEYCKRFVPLIIINYQYLLYRQQIKLSQPYNISTGWLFLCTHLFDTFYYFVDSISVPYMYKMNKKYEKVLILQTKEMIYIMIDCRIGIC